MICIVVVLIVAAFVAGKVYGARAEAFAIARILNTRAAVSAEYKAVVADIKAKESALLVHLKKYL